MAQWFAAGSLSDHQIRGAPHLFARMTQPPKVKKKRTQWIRGPNRITALIFGNNL